VKKVIILSLNLLTDYILDITIFIVYITDVNKKDTIVKTPVNTSEPKFRTLVDVQKRFPDEQSCRDYLESVRWGGKPVCVHCGSTEKMYRIQNGKLLKCSACRRPFSVKVGTIFEDSALPLTKWFYACWLISAHKKGISSCQLARDLGVTQKTAWHMLHRVRLSMQTNSFDKPLSGTVEADETYIGGRRVAQGSGKTGRGTDKTIVFGMAQRGGDVRSMPVPDVTGQTLKSIINNNVEKGAKIMTDHFSGYSGLIKDFAHRRVSHLKKTYVNGEIHTQNIENFWGLLKRGILGIYHHTSAEHLHRYCSEFEFRHNTRKIDDGERFTSVLHRSAGRRLTYQQLTENK
jgi:transposase-like protein